MTVYFISKDDKLTSSRRLRSSILIVCQSNVNCMLIIFILVMFLYGSIISCTPKTYNKNKDLLGPYPGLS